MGGGRRGREEGVKRRKWKTPLWGEKGQSTPLGLRRGWQLTKQRTAGGGEEEERCEEDSRLRPIRLLVPCLDPLPWTLRVLDPKALDTQILDPSALDSSSDHYLNLFPIS